MSNEQSNAEQELRERVARTIQAAESYEFAWGDYLKFADAVLAALGLDDPPEDNDLPPCTCIRTRSGGFVTPITGPDACPRHVVNGPPDTSSP